MLRPKNFILKLKSLDRRLDLEWLGDHWAVIDTSHPISVQRLDDGGVVRIKRLYDRICHLKPCQWLGTGVLNKLRWMSMERWGKPGDLIKALEDQEVAAEKEKEEEKVDLYNDFLAEKNIIDSGRKSFHMKRGNV